MERQIVSVPRYSNVYNCAPRYSEQNGETLGKKLDNKETFYDALQVLIAWLERGECNVRNSACFYSLIEQCWNHVEKLQSELYKNLEEAKKDESGFVGEFRSIQLQLIDIEDLYEVMDKQNIWNFFNQNHLEDLKWMQANIVNVKKSIWGEYEYIKEKQSNREKSNDINIKVVLPENNVDNFQPKPSISTYDLAKEKVKICKENDTLKLRPESEISGGHQEQSKSIINGDSQQKNPVVNVAFQSNPDENELNNIDIEVVHPENNVHKIQANVGNLTSELNTAYQETEEMGKGSKDHERQKKRKLKKRRKCQQKTNLGANGDNSLKTPVKDVSSQSNAVETTGKKKGETNLIIDGNSQEKTPAIDFASLPTAVQNEKESNSVNIETVQPENVHKMQAKFDNLISEINTAYQETEVMGNSKEHENERQKKRKLKKKRRRQQKTNSGANEDNSLKTPVSDVASNTVQTTRNRKKKTNCIINGDQWGRRCQQVTDLIEDGDNTQKKPVDSQSNAIEATQKRNYSITDSVRGVRRDQQKTNSTMDGDNTQINLVNEVASQYNAIEFTQKEKKKTNSIVYEDNQQKNLCLLGLILLKLIEKKGNQMI